MRESIWCQTRMVYDLQFKFKLGKNVHNLTGFLDLAGNAFIPSPKENSISVYKHLLIRIQDELDERNRLVSTRMVYDLQSNLNSKSVHNLTGFLDLAGNALFQVPRKFYICIQAFV